MTTQEYRQEIDAQSADQREQKAKSLADVPDLPKTRLVTTGTLVGITRPTPREKETLLRAHGATYSADTDTVLIPQTLAKRIALFVECDGKQGEDCIGCILVGEGYQF